MAFKRLRRRQNAKALVRIPPREDVSRGPGRKEKTGPPVPPRLPAQSSLAFWQNKFLSHQIALGIRALVPFPACRKRQTVRANRMVHPKFKSARNYRHNNRAAVLGRRHGTRHTFFALPKFRRPQDCVNDSRPLFHISPSLRCRLRR
jgi:hypothetical protein